MTPRSCWLAPLLLSASTLVAQHPTFKTSVEAVRVDVLVTRGGQPVRGLTARDFQVRDNGILQDVEHVSFEEIPLNVVLALDGSDSVKGERERHLRTASLALLDRLKPRDQAALVRFGDAVVVHSELTPKMSKVRAALDEPMPFGYTSLVDAAYAGLVLGESQPGRALVIVFSDGVEVSSYLDVQAVINAAKRSDAVVYGVATTNGGNRPFLHDLTDATGGELFEIPQNGDLDATFVNVLNQFRRRYLLSYTPRGVPEGGWHRLQVRVDRRGVTVKARPGYSRN